MNKRAETDPFNVVMTITLMCFLLVAGSFLYTIFIIDDSNGYSFCEREGYDSVNSRGGYYSEFYNSIECTAQFKDNSTSKVFNVERRFGRFYEIEKLKNNGK